MTNIILNGACGRMGRAIGEASASFDACIVAGVDKFAGACSFPLYDDLEKVYESADVLVDFTVHTATDDLIAFARRTGIPMVVATTGHTEEEMAAYPAMVEAVMELQPDM